MKSILFCTSYMGDEASWQRRYKPWLQYYSRHRLGVENIVLIDDGSPFTPTQREIHCLEADSAIPVDLPHSFIARFNQRLGRSSLLCYPGWWRSFLHSVSIARQLNADKIIHIESDAFILSEDLLQHIRRINSGWTCLWSPHYKIAESAIQVICADQYHKFDTLRHTPQSELDGNLAEDLLPFTHVEKSFKGDRYGDIRQNRWIFRSRKFHDWPLFEHDFFWAKVPADADFATQVTDRLWRNSAVLRELGLGPHAITAT